ncbi:DNA glycosylase AlkZ-like family protein [Candidatus Bipolaricaulota sp. J31]
MAIRRRDFDGRARFLSPLDPLLWSRKALMELWDFEYAREVGVQAPDGEEIRSE